MKLIFERSVTGTRSDFLPPCDVPLYELSPSHRRAAPPRLPEMTEGELSRHYSAIESGAFGVNSGFYPLGSCTMKYSPKINEEIAAFPGFSDVHPLQPDHSVFGCLEALRLAEAYLSEITGMDNICFQPAAGAHGEFTGLLLIKKYHLMRGETNRVNLIVPDTCHGTNPASASMAGFKTVAIDSGADGLVDLEALRKLVDENTAGLMLTNPNTLGLFEKNILEIAKIVHDAGGLLYYDGANLNPLMGVVRPGDSGFDVLHLNLHKTFGTPHGAGGPGSGPVGCKAFLSDYLPVPRVMDKNDGLSFSYDFNDSIGRVKAFYGNFGVIIKALSYIINLGGSGLLDAAQNAVLNANYMMKCLEDVFEVAFPGRVMHEFVLSAESIKKETGVSAIDLAKGMLDNGMHPPTVYFPINVHEALMVEPTETESKASIDEAVCIYRKLREQAYSNPESLHEAPINTSVRRLDEVGAARNPILRYEF